MIKKLMKKYQQYLCTHPIVVMKSGAKHKAGWKDFHSVRCDSCNKTWRELGEKLYFEYKTEKECHCKFSK